MNSNYADSCWGVGHDELIRGGMSGLRFWERRSIYLFIHLVTYWPKELSFEPRPRRIWAKCKWQREERIMVLQKQNKRLKKNMEVKTENWVWREERRQRNEREHWGQQRPISLKVGAYWLRIWIFFLKKEDNLSFMYLYLIIFKFLHCHCLYLLLPRKERETQCFPFFLSVGITPSQSQHPGIGLANWPIISCEIH